jgi:uncharacterized protein YcbK (DUF882 family)
MVQSSAGMVTALSAEKPVAASASAPTLPQEVRPLVQSKPGDAPPPRAEQAPKQAREQFVLLKAPAPAAPEAEQFTVEIANTGQVVEVKLDGPAGEPDEESYRALRHALRCQRTGAENPIDPRLLELLHQISVTAHERIQVVSAFRAPVHPGDLNYHVRGMAADIRVPGLSTAELRDLAKSLGATGVGYYPTVQFVHVDVREMPYFWTDTSGHNDNRQDEVPSTPGASASSTTSPMVLPTAASLTAGSAASAAASLGLLQPPSPPPPPAASSLLPTLPSALTHPAAASEKTTTGSFAPASHAH